MGWINTTQQQRDHSGLRNVCAGCGHEGSPRNPLVLSEDGFRIHGACGKKQEPAGARP